MRQLNVIIARLTIYLIVLIAKMRGGIAPEMRHKRCMPFLADQRGTAEIGRGDVLRDQIPRVHRCGLSVRWRICFHGEIIAN